MSVKALSHFTEIKYYRSLPNEETSKIKLTRRMTTKTAISIFFFFKNLRNIQIGLNMECMTEGRSKTKGQVNKIREHKGKRKRWHYNWQKKDVNFNFYSSCVQKQLSNHWSGALRELRKGYRQGLDEGYWGRAGWRWEGIGNWNKGAGHLGVSGVFWRCPRLPLRQPILGRAILPVGWHRGVGGAFRAVWELQVGGVALATVALVTLVSNIAVVGGPVGIAVVVGAAIKALTWITLKYTSVTLEHLYKHTDRWR